MHIQWNGFGAGLCRWTDGLYSRGELTDVDLICGADDDARTFKAHRLILAGASSYFRKVFQDLDSYKHPVVFVPTASPSDLERVLQFVYRGEVSLPEEDLDKFVEVARGFGFRGVAEAAAAKKRNGDTLPKKIQAKSAVVTPKTPQPQSTPVVAPNLEKKRKKSSLKSILPRPKKLDDADLNGDSGIDDDVEKEMPKARKPKIGPKSKISNVNNEKQENDTDMPQSAKPEKPAESVADTLMLDASACDNLAAEIAADNRWSVAYADPREVMASLHDSYDSGNEKRPWSLHVSRRRQTAMKRLSRGAGGQEIRKRMTAKEELLWFLLKRLPVAAAGGKVEGRDEWVSSVMEAWERPTSEQIDGFVDFVHRHKLALESGNNGGGGKSGQSPDDAIDIDD